METPREALERAVSRNIAEGSPEYVNVSPSFRDNVRDFEQSSKFDGTNRRLAAICYLVTLDGGADESYSFSEDGDGMDRIGRHIIEHSSDGFVSVTSFDTEQEAMDAYTRAVMRDYMDNGYQ